MKTFIKIVIGIIATPFFLIGIIAESIVLGFFAGVEWCEKLSEKR